MKKFLLSMFVAAAAVATAGAETVTFDFVNETYGMERLSGSTNQYNENPTVITSEGVSITLNGNTRLWSDGLRFYKESTFVVSVPEGAVTSITVAGKNETATNSFKAEGYSEGTWTGSANSVAFECTITKSNVAIASLTVNYDAAAATKKNAGLLFSEAKIKTIVGQEFTVPTLTKATDAEVTWTSSDEAVATVNAEGEVELIGAGTAEITASTPENEEYSAGEASYEIVVAAALPENTVAFGLIYNANEWSFETIEKAEELGDVWYWNSNYDYLSGSGFKSSTPYAAKALAISPVIDLTEKTNAAFSFEQAASYQTTIADECGLRVREEGAEEWTALPYTTLPEAGTWDYSNSGEISLADFSGKKIQVAFFYGSTAEGADTWRIRRFIATADDATAISTVEADAEGEAVYYNLQGVRVANPAGGVFIKVAGKKAVKVVM